MENKKKMAIASLIMSLLSLVPTIVLPDSLTGAQIVVIISIFLAIVGATLGFIGKSASKGLAISGIVIGIISCVILALTLVGISMYQNATDCVDNGNETSTCKYMNEEIEVPNSMLREDQMKE